MQVSVNQLNRKRAQRSFLIKPNIYVVTKNVRPENDTGLCTLLTHTRSVHELTGTVGTGPTSWCGGSSPTSWSGESDLTSWCGESQSSFRKMRNGKLVDELAHTTQNNFLGLSRLHKPVSFLFKRSLHKEICSDNTKRATALTLNGANVLYPQAAFSSVPPFCLFQTVRRQQQQQQPSQPQHPSLKDLEQAQEPV